MNLTQISPPTVAPVTFEQAKDFLKLEDTENNDLVIALIESATKQAEEYCGCSFLSQQWSLFFDATELDNILELPRPSVLNINNVFYYLEDDSQNVFGAVNYRVDKNSRPGRFALKDLGIFPVGLRDINSFEIQYTAGFGTLITDVPDNLIQAVKIIVTKMFEDREDGKTIPDSAKKLLDIHRVYHL